MDIKDFLKSAYFSKATKAVAIMLVFLLTLGLGIMVGYRKAEFSYRWGENYHRVFGGPREGVLGRLPPPPDSRDFIDAHGSSGVVIKNDSDLLIIRGRDDVEKPVLISTSTVIRKKRQTIGKDKIRIGDMLTAIGSPDGQGRIDAKFIRIF